jgi:hypothetical protein
MAKKKRKVYAVWYPDGGMEPLQIRDVTVLAAHPTPHRDIQLAIHVFHWEQIEAKSEKAAMRIYWYRQNHPRPREKNKPIVAYAVGLHEPAI